MQHTRIVEADKAWQQAHNSPNTLPDLGTLIDWLMEKAGLRVVNSTLCPKCGGNREDPSHNMLTCSPVTEALMQAGMESICKPVSVIAPNTLEVGNDGKEVIINHPDLQPDENGVGHIAFSPEQARNLARLLNKHADELELRSPIGLVTCKARSANMGANDPQDCNWPMCGCDAYADKVIEALQESGVIGEEKSRNIDGKFGVHIGKYATDGIKIVNLVSREEIPQDEPLFLLRARDNLAIPVIAHYRELCSTATNELHQAGINQILQKFHAFASEHPERMKEPGKTRHLKLEEKTSGSHLPVVGMQQLIDAGLNAFGLQLFAESVAGKTDAKTFNPFVFMFRNIKITLEPVGEVDTAHH